MIDEVRFVYFSMVSSCSEDIGDISEGVVVRCLVKYPSWVKGRQWVLAKKKYDGYNLGTLQNFINNLESK